MRFPFDGIHAVEEVQFCRSEESFARQLVETPWVELVPASGFVHRHCVETFFFGADLFEFTGKQAGVLLAGEAREIGEHCLGLRLADVGAVEIEEEDMIVVQKIGFDHDGLAVIAPALFPSGRHGDEPPVADAHGGSARFDDARFIQRHQESPEILLKRHGRTLETQGFRERLIRRQSAQELGIGARLAVIELDEGPEEFARLGFVHQMFEVLILRPDLRRCGAVVGSVADVAAGGAGIFSHFAEEAFDELCAGVVFLGGQVHDVQRKHDAVAVYSGFADRRREHNRFGETGFAVVGTVVGQENPRSAVTPDAEREGVADDFIGYSDFAVVVAGYKLNRDDVLALHVHDDADFRAHRLVSAAVGGGDADHEIAVLTVRDPCFVGLDGARIAFDKTAVVLQVVVFPLPHVGDEAFRPAGADVFADLVKRGDRHARVFQTPFQFEHPVDFSGLLLIRLEVVRLEGLPEGRVAVERFFAAVVAQQNVGVAVVGGAVRKTAEARLLARAGQPVAIVGVVQHGRAVLAAFRETREGACAVGGDVFGGFPFRHTGAAGILVDFAHELHLLVAERAFLLREFARRAAQKRRLPRDSQSGMISRKRSDFADGALHSRRSRKRRILRDGGFSLRRLCLKK